MPTFLTDFAPPPAVGNLEINAVLEASRVELSWDVSGLADVDFGGYRVYRSDDTGVTWELLAVQPVKTNVTFEDYEAPLNVVLFYRVTQSNLDFESEPAEGSVSLSSLMWWVVVPDDDTLTFAIPKVRGVSLTTPKTMDFFRPIGRPSAVAVGDVVHDDEGALTFLAMPDNPAMVSLVKRAMAKMDAAIVLKSPTGDVHTVQYGAMTRSYTDVPGMFEVSLPFVGVG